jgi:two-component system OmpR family response regulator
LGGRFSGRGSVVVADADEGFRREIGRALTAAGFEVVEAASGDEALAAALDDGAVLAVLDVRLAGISGYEVCRRLREARGDRVAIVFVSADRVESSDRVAGLIVGADDYLVKPVARDEIVARVRRLLARSPRRFRPRLTEREARCFGCWPQARAGRSGRLSISPKTVATHVEHIYEARRPHPRAGRRPGVPAGARGVS